jgi:hypothetical protein
MGLPILLVLFAIRPPHHWGMAIVPSIAICSSIGLIVLQKAERRGKVKSIEELHRPLTLFPRLPGPPSSRDLMKTIPFGA